MRPSAIFASLLLLSSCSLVSPPADTPQAKAPPAEIQSPGSAVTPEKIEATYESIKKNLVDAKCLQCHKTGGKEEKIPFETQEQILHGFNKKGPFIVPGRAVESGFFRVLVSDQSIRGNLKPMPPAKAIAAGTVQPVTAEEIRAVEDWINHLPSLDVADPASESQ